MIRSYKFRLYPTKAQAAELNAMLGTFCWLYNQMIEERRDGWRNYGHSFTYAQQSAGLKYLRRDERLGRYSARAELFIVRRADLAFGAFFRRQGADRKPGFPRFKSAGRFDSARFEVGDGMALNGARTSFKGISGIIRVKRHREMQSDPKTVTLRREGVRWFLICHAAIEPTPTDREHSPVGIDVGLANLIATSDGETVAAPQYSARAAKRVRRHRRALARAVKGSRRRQKASERLAGVHRKTARQRRDFLHKLSRRIVDGHSHIAIEDLRIANMMRSNLGKAIQNAAWATLRAMIEHKAEEAGVQVIAVRPHGTSQYCSGCGVEVPKTLSVRVHDCPHCRLSIDRDVNAARNVLARAEFPPGTGGQDKSQRVAA